MYLSSPQPLSRLDDFCQSCLSSFSLHSATVFTRDCLRFTVIFGGNSKLSVFHVVIAELFIQHHVRTASYDYSIWGILKLEKL